MYLLNNTARLPHQQPNTDVSRYQVWNRVILQAVLGMDFEGASCIAPSSMTVILRKRRDMQS